MKSDQSLTTRFRWIRYVEKLPSKARPEHRRDDDRPEPSLGSVTLLFIQDGMHVERTGPLLNVSSDGLMIRQHREIHERTLAAMFVYTEEGTFKLKGTVRHCTGTVGGYKVGFALEFADKPAPGTASSPPIENA